MLAWCVNWIKEQLRILGSELDFAWRGTFPGQPFAISTDWRALGGAGSPRAVRPSVPQHQEYRKKDNTAHTVGSLMKEYQRERVRIEENS